MITGGPMMTRNTILKTHNTVWLKDLAGIQFDIKHSLEN